HDTALGYLTSLRDGSFTYASGSGDGSPDSFTFTAVTADGDDSTVGTVTVNVIEVNDLTVTSPTLSTNEDVPLTGNVLAGAHDSRSEERRAGTAGSDRAYGHVTIHNEGRHTD